MKETSAVNAAPAPIGVWLVAVKAGTGTDAYTVRLVEALNKRGVRAEVTWLPLRAEYAPWTVLVPKAPEWVTVIHINSWLHNRFIPRDLPVVTTFHFCVHDQEYFEYKSVYQALYHKFWVKPIERKNIKSSCVVTAVSRYTANVVEKTFACMDVRPIYNWVDFEKFKPVERREKRDKCRVLFVGNPSYRKGKDLLPKIMAKLGDRYELWVTGSETAFKGVQCPANMKMIGWHENEKDLISLYQRCDLLLFPSRMEGFGYAALEAQACGLPVVCTNGTSLPEVVKDGITGMLCKKDDVDSFVRAIQFISGKKDQMSPACRQWAESFSEEFLVKQYIELYQTC